MKFQIWRSSSCYRSLKMKLIVPIYLVIRTEIVINCNIDYEEYHQIVSTKEDILRPFYYCKNNLEICHKKSPNICFYYSLNACRLFTDCSICRFNCIILHNGNRYYLEFYAYRIFYCATRHQTQRLMDEMQEVQQKKILNEEFSDLIDGYMGKNYLGSIAYQ